MAGNVSSTFLDQLLEVIEQSQRAGREDIDRARREMARERMEREKADAEKKRAEKEEADKAAMAKTKKKPLLTEETDGSKSPLGEKFDARKMVIYSEIMNPKYKD